MAIVLLIFLIFISKFVDFVNIIVGIFTVIFVFVRFIC